MARLPRTIPAAGIVIALALPARATIDEVVLERLVQSAAPVCVAVGQIATETSTVFACSDGAGRPTFDETSIFQIGSVTKGLTGLLLADMVVRGEVAIDDPAAKYARPGAKLPARGGRHVTLRDLVTHTAGLPRTPPGFAPRDPANPYGHFDEDALYASLAQTELTHDIGAQYAYSNLGFMWLSDLLARRAGKSYEELLVERIARPLGMTSTGIRPPPGSRTRLVSGHDGAYRAIPSWTIGGNLGGVGLVHSTLADMLKLAEALSGKRRTPLDTAIELAIRPPSPLAAPNIGYAWNIRAHGGRLLYDHGGGTGGFIAHVTFDREARRASVVLADAAESIFDLSIHLVDPGYHLRRRPAEVPVQGSRRDYVGTYGSGALVLKVWEDSGRLLAQAEGQLIVEILHQGREMFYAREVDMQLAFERSRGGKVEGVSVYIDGRQSRWRRVSR